MTSKERMLTALRRGVPDRMPMTVHQWQRYHLTHYMGGIDRLEAFRRMGLDASIATPDVHKLRPSPDWLITTQDLGDQPEGRVTGTRIVTPRGTLTMQQARGTGTVFVTEHLIKNQQDAELFLARV